MQLVGRDQLGKTCSHRLRMQHLDFATNRSTAIQHDGGKVQLALPVIAFR
jgi:hypothetical protein